jgi:hypothetical protein
MVPLTIKEVVEFLNFLLVALLGFHDLASQHNNLDAEYVPSPIEPTLCR